MGETGVSIKRILLITTIPLVIVLTTVLFEQQTNTGEYQLSPELGLETGTVSDIDGNAYQTIKIGDQWWMAENLKVLRYRNGDTILFIESDTEWRNTQSGGYTIYPPNGYTIIWPEPDPNSKVRGIDSNTDMVSHYGLLYNWYAVDETRGLCPEGWSVPSETEWSALENILGGRIAAQGKMKSIRVVPDHHPRWERPNDGATNESGFSGLPGGYRYSDGQYASLGFVGSWWSSTDYRMNWAYFRDLSRRIGEEQRYYYDHKNSGFSVRCIKN
jgi:uncharacterized protein (TIGR02145 family)